MKKQYSFFYGLECPCFAYFYLNAINALFFNIKYFNYKHCLPSRNYLQEIHWLTIIWEKHNFCLYKHFYAGFIFIFSEYISKLFLSSFLGNYCSLPLLINISIFTFQKGSNLHFFFPHFIADVFF